MGAIAITVNVDEFRNYGDINRKGRGGVYSKYQNDGESWIVFNCDYLKYPTEYKVIKLVRAMTLEYISAGGEFFSGKEDEKLGENT